MLPSKHTRIGVDIGATGVRAVQLLRQGDAYVVRAVANSGRSVDDHKAEALPLERRIATCLSAGGFRGRDLVVGAQAGHIEYHLIDLPGVMVAKADEETTQAVRWEVGSLMGEPAENIEAGYWLVPPPSSPGPNTLAVGIREQSVRTTFDACLRAGSTCGSIDAPAAALCRAVLALRPDANRTVWGILDLGFEQTRLVVCVDDTPVLVRSVGPGGAQWTQRIAETLSISEKAAEVHNCEYGVERIGRGSSVEAADVDPGSELASLLYRAIRTDLIALASETQRSFQYVLGCYAGRELSDLVLVGGGANLKGLDAFIGGQIGSPVLLASALLNKNGSRVQFSSTRGESFERLTLAVGLAMPS